MLLASGGFCAPLDFVLPDAPDTWYGEDGKELTVLPPGAEISFNFDTSVLTEQMKSIGEAATAMGESMAAFNHEISPVFADIAEKLSQVYGIPVGMITTPEQSDAVAEQLAAKWLTHHDATLSQGKADPGMKTIWENGVITKDGYKLAQGWAPTMNIPPDEDDLFAEEKPSSRLWCHFHGQHWDDPEHMGGDLIACDSGDWIKPALPHEEKLWQAKRKGLLT
jgi:hypothetical protein